VHAATPLLQRALAYLNVDTGASGPHFRAIGTPSLAQVLAGVLGAIDDPGRPGHTLADHWGEGDLYPLGSGSDYTAFIDHLGIPSLDLAFSAKTAYGVYHSVYDSFEWMDSVGDPGFHYHKAMAQMWGLVALRLAGSAPAAAGDDSLRVPLPLNFTHQAEAIAGYIAAAKARPNGTKVDYLALDAAHARFAAASRKLHADLATAAHDADTIAALDERLAYTERRFLSTNGLPGRKYFKHVLQAPGLYTGYAPKTLPGVYDAVDVADFELATEQANAAAERIDAAARFLEGAH